MNSPNRCDGLYTVPPLNSIRFWSVAPPRTLYPLDASPTDVTPGSVSIIFMMSDSPNADGMFFRICGLNFSAPIIMLFTALCRPPTTTISASSWSSATLTLAFFTPGTTYTLVFDEPAVDIVSMSSTGIPAISFFSSICRAGCAGCSFANSSSSAFHSSTGFGVPPMPSTSIAKLASRLFFEKRRRFLVAYLLICFFCSGNSFATSFALFTWCIFPSGVTSV